MKREERLPEKTALRESKTDKPCFLAVPINRRNVGEGVNAIFGAEGAGDLDLGVANIA